MKIVVIGGGVAGLFTSYYLTKNGHSVVVVDKDVDQDRTSIYNAGFITPSFPASGTVSYTHLTLPTICSV